MTFYVKNCQGFCLFWGADMGEKDLNISLQVLICSAKTAVLIPENDDNLAG